MHHRGGVEEEGGVVWWEIRLGDSPGSKSTGINPKLSKSTKKGKKMKQVRRAWKVYSDVDSQLGLG